MKINELVGQTLECPCGKIHEVRTVMVREGKGAISSLARDMCRLAPEGAQVALVYEPRCLKEARAVEKELFTAGYLVTMLTPSRPSEREEKYFSAVVGVGEKSLCDYAKLFAQSLQKKLLLVPLTLNGCASPLATVCEKDGYVVQKLCNSPHSVVVDYGLIPPKFNTLACGFGWAVSRLFSAVDYIIVGWLTGERTCREIYRKIKREVAMLVEKVSGLDRRDKSVAQAIASAGTVISLLEQGVEGGIYGGEVAATLCAEMLANHESRRAQSYGESAFLYATALVDLYAEGLFLSQKAFLPPPDNNRRADLIAEYLGIASAVSDKYQKKPLDNLALMKYRAKIYREEILSELADAKKIFSMAKKTFFRLYGDDGFSVDREREEGALCVALAPDVSEQVTCLDYLKACGVLDGFLF